MVIGMDYPVIDPVGTGSNIRNLIRNCGNSIADVGRNCFLRSNCLKTAWKLLRVVKNTCRWKNCTRLQGQGISVPYSI